MGSGLFGDYGGTEGRVTTTEPQPQDTNTIPLANHWLPLAQRSRMEKLGYKASKDTTWNPLINALLETGATLAHPIPGR